jgi:hypothetical protein
MSIKLAGCSTLLVRAVEMDGTEVGMTAWAQMTASLLGMHMCGASPLCAILTAAQVRCSAGGCCTALAATASVCANIKFAMEMATAAAWRGAWATQI